MDRDKALATHKEYSRKKVLLALGLGASMAIAAVTASHNERYTGGGAVAEALEDMSCGLDEGGKIIFRGFSKITERGRSINQITCNTNSTSGMVITNGTSGSEITLNSERFSAEAAPASLPRRVTS